MKSNIIPASRAARNKFAPYSPLPARPSATTARYGAHLRAATLAPYEALNTWLAANITEDSRALPERSLHAHEALCVLTMFILKVCHLCHINPGHSLPPRTRTMALSFEDRMSTPSSSKSSSTETAKVRLCVSDALWDLRAMAMHRCGRASSNRANHTTPWNRGPLRLRWPAA